MITSIFYSSIIFLCILVCSVSSYKILGVFPTISKSHFMVFESLTKGLAEKGHNVTVLTNYPSNPLLKNYREVYIPINNESFVPFLTKKTASLYEVYIKLDKLMDLQHRLVDDTFAESLVHEIMREETFDLVIVEKLLGTVFLGFGAHFKCPTATFVSYMSWHSFYRESGSPLALPYISHSHFGLPHPLSFKSRVLNMLLYMIDLVYLEPLIRSKHLKSYRKYFPPNLYPTFDEMEKNVSIHFITLDISVGNVRPLTPSVVQINGIHINDQINPLPDDLQQWMNESKNGVVYFSLGSNVKSASLPEKKVKDILNAFRGLKENVLWKFENDSLPNLPKNVRIEKWLPQNDVLQHKNIKLFITHGGWGSITEAKYHGVPLIITPLLGDQMANAVKVVGQGWGIQFSFDEIGEDVMKKLINTVLTNPKYAEKARYLSILHRDRQNTPLETGIYWVEYVIRHHGAKHLQSSAVNLSFWQLHSLDVIGFLLCVIIFGSFCSYKLLSFIFCSCCRRLNKIKTQ